ncbi:MAG: RHS repeat-associated core domain-containing protein [Gammaproteobacteria bacterium]|nr:RHS repeat-associated core domain-containing protein [Gammaproteobacteria bacterium]
MSYDGTEVDLRFPGQVYDVETGLYYNYFRYYDPETGRYVTSDPIGLYGGLNTFVYVGNDPINWIDPYGLDVNYNGFVVNNPKVRQALNNMDKNLPGKNIDVTGGDRYIDSDGNVRSSTTGEIVPNSGQKSPHAQENGARGVDVKVPGATNEEIKDAANKSGFPDYNTKQDYDDGHSHFNLPKTPNNYIPEGILNEFCRQNPGAPNCKKPQNCQ